MGAVVLAFPVALTEEVWNLGSEISGTGAIVIGIISLALIFWYNYHAHYEARLDTHGFEFVLRMIVVAAPASSAATALDSLR